jgi:UV DNA damage endonuclease
MRLGYCCINLSLQPQGVTANRGMIKRTFQEKGIAYCGQLALANIKDVLKILEWNVENGVYVYRMSSDIFPWMSEYRFEDLPNYSEIKVEAQKIGQFAKKHNIRLSMHPGQFDVLASPTESIVEKTIWDLDQHARIMDLMELPSSYEAPINIHIGGTYGDKTAALQRFCTNFKRLAPSTQDRLVVENDDKASQYSVKDLYEGVYLKVGCPITFDHFHHRFCTGGLDADTAAHLAASTWDDITPLQHFSDSKALYEDASVINRSHSDWIYTQIPSYGLEADIELECKMKDLALLQYRKGEGVVAENKLFPFETVEINLV